MLIRKETLMEPEMIIYKAASVLPFVSELEQ